MWYGFPSRLILGLGLLIGGVFGAAHLGGQPPGKGPKGPPFAEYVTVRGTVKDITTAPKGEVDGLILNDGTWVHWPPHLEDRFKNLAARGDRVKATGYWETGPKGDTKLEVATLTNVATGKSSDNPDRPPPQGGAGGRLGARPGEALMVRGIVRELTSAPKGEVDGALLNDGTWVHWPPHLENRFTAIVGKGDRIKAVGCWETGPKGDSKLEVSSVTNLATDKTATNPDKPLVGQARGLPGSSGDIEDRLQALEDKIDQLTREIERLRRSK